MLSEDKYVIDNYEADYKILPELDNGDIQLNKIERTNNRLGEEIVL